MAGEMTERAATTVFVVLLSGDDDYCKVVVELAERLHKADSPCQLVVAVLPAVPESRRAQRPHLAWLRRPRLRGRARAPTGEPGPPCHHLLRRQAPHLGVRGVREAGVPEPGDEHNLRGRRRRDADHRHPVVRGQGGVVYSRAWPAAAAAAVLQRRHVRAGAQHCHRQGHARSAPRDVPHSRRASPGLPKHNFKDQYKPIPLEEKLALSMLANKANKCTLAERKLPPFSSWLATTKEAIFARKNLPAMATLAASSAAAGVITTAANPAICFGFYALFNAAIAFVTISLHKI